MENLSTYHQKSSRERQQSNIQIGEDTKDSISASVRNTPLARYQNIRQSGEFLMNGDAVPYQKPLLIPSERSLEAPPISGEIALPEYSPRACIIPTVSNSPRLINGRSRPLPVPNRSPNTGMYSSNQLTCKRSPDLSMPSPNQETFHPPAIFQNSVHRPLPLPQQRTALAPDQSVSRPKPFLSSVSSTMSSVPSLSHSHSRSMSGSTSSDNALVAFPLSTSSHQMALSVSSGRLYCDLGATVPKPTPLQMGPFANAAPQLGFAPPRPFDSQDFGQAEAVDNNDAPWTNKGANSAFCPPSRRSGPLSANQQRRRLPPIPHSFSNSTQPPYFQNPHSGPPNSNGKEGSLPTLPPLDLGFELSLASPEFQFLSPEITKQQQKSTLPQATIEKEEDGGLDRTGLTEALAVAPSTPPISCHFPPIHSSLVSQHPKYPVALISSYEPLAERTDASTSGSPITGRPPGPLKKPKPVLKVRTWDLDPPKKRRTRKLQVVQTQALETPEQKAPPSLEIEMKPDPGPVPIAPPGPTPPSLAPPSLAPPARLSAGQATIHTPIPQPQQPPTYTIPKIRPPYVPPDDEHSSIGYRSIGKSNNATGCTTGTRDRKWSGIAAQLKKLRINHRKSSSVSTWEGGGVFLKINSASTPRAPFPHTNLTASSLSNISSSLYAHPQMHPQTEPSSTCFAQWGLQPTFRSASVPRPSEPSLRNEPTFLDPESSRFIPRPFTTTPVRRPINALWTKIRGSSSKQRLGYDERVDLL